MADGSRNGFQPEVADAMFSGLEGVMRDAPAATSTIAQLAKYRRRLGAIECAVLADMKAAGNTDRNNESAARETGRSKKAAAAAAKRGAAVQKNRALGTALAEGDIGESELDAIAYASAQTGGAGATSEDLFNQIKAAGPDKASAVARQWVDEQKTQDEHDSRYGRQRALRKICSFTTRRGTKAVMAEGDDEMIDHILEQIFTKADEIYKSDGGRDVTAAKHPRTYDQRNFDAFAELITSNKGCSTEDPGSVDHAGTAAATFHVITYASDWTEAGPNKGFRLDGRRLPTSLLDRMFCSAALVGTVFNGDGEVLFHGRGKRLATPAQVRALIARDKGCVQCGVSPTRCQAHHLTPYNSTKAGQTDINQMALMCQSCHHELHDNNQTLYWTHGPPRRGPTQSDTAAGTPTRVWKTRPALPDEITLKRKAA